MIIHEIKTGLFVLKQKSHIDLLFHIFWLIGPFLLLIERSPGDLWITLLALAFLFRSLTLRDFRWVKVRWVQAILLFLSVCIISAALSADPIYALGEAFVWVRFPIFAIASTYWFCREESIYKLMLISIGASLILMCGILTAEIMFDVEKSRLSWPYGDLVSGNFLTNWGFPLLVFAQATVTAQKKTGVLTGLFVFLILLFTFLTGKFSFHILFCGAILCSLTCKPVKFRVFLLLLISLLSFALLVYFFPYKIERWTSEFLNHLPTDHHSAYFRAMAPGILAFETSPIIGIGTGNYRNLCEFIIMGYTQLECHPHPHNFYIQILAETGLVGLFFGMAFISMVFLKCFCYRQSKDDRIFVVTAWVVPLAYFWPIASTADFFGQWNNIFMWTGLAIALGATNISSKARE